MKETSRYKAAIMDYDGTLSASGSSREICEIMRLAHKREIVPVVATGKGLYFIRDVAKECMDAWGIGILHDGSLVSDLSTGEAILSSPISKKTLADVTERLSSAGVDFYLNSDSGLHSAKNNLSKDSSLFKYWRPIADNDAASVYQIYIRDIDDERLPQVKEALGQPELDFYVFMSSRRGYGILARKKGTSKAKAARIVLENLNISEQETVVIGDGVSDLEMFDMASHKIAMHGSIPEVAAKADRILRKDETLIDVIKKI